MRTRPADLIVAVFVCSFLGTLAIAEVIVKNEYSARVKCASNLRMIGQAMLLYSNENKGSFPRTLWNSDKLTPTWGTPYEGMEKRLAQGGPLASPYDAKTSKVLPADNDVTAAMWMLMRTQDITPAAFICPSTGQTPVELGKTKAADWTNWPGRKAIADHLGYSMANPYASKDVVKKGFKWNNALSAEFALVGDMNPGVELLSELTGSSSQMAMSLGNSINHGRIGQNVLYGDGHVEFQDNPLVGVERDNIYASAGEGRTIVAAPASGADSVMLPTAVDIGMINKDGSVTDETRKRRDEAAAKWQPPAKVDLDGRKKKIVGKYTREEAGLKLTLEVSDDSMTVTGGPATFKLAYHVQEASPWNGLYAVITSSDQAPTLAHVKQTDKGVYLYKGAQASGEWTRQ